MTLVVEKIVGLATVQDLGRVGRMHEGLPHGGALVRSLLARANRAARNPDDAPAIELFGRLVVRAAAPIVVSVDGEPRALVAGETLALASEPRRVAYLAVRGGVAAPIVLGSCSTHLSAGLGAPLRAGDVIAAGDVTPRDTAIDPHADTDDPIRVIPGPDLDARTLLAVHYKILPTSDRIGTRLDGPPIARGDVVEHSRPMVRGAIEIPRDGLPIVLGPEHPTTGGYPVIAVIASADLDRFFATRLGGTVRFAL